MRTISAVHRARQRAYGEANKEESSGAVEPQDAAPDVGISAGEHAAASRSTRSTSLWDSFRALKTPVSGARSHVSKIKPLYDTALRAVRTLGLEVAGVDLLPSARGPLIIEVNPCPGLEGIERVTGINVAGQVIDRLEEKLSALRSRVRSKVGA